MQEALSGAHSLRGPKANLHPTPSSLYREPVRARLTPSWPPFLAPSLCVVGGPEAKKLARTTKAQRLERPTMTSHDGAGDAEGPPRQRTCFTALSWPGAWESREISKSQNARCGGGGRIRTHGRHEAFNGFQGRRFRPLSHPSAPAVHNLVIRSSPPM